MEYHGGLEYWPKNYGSPRMVDRVRIHVRSRSDVSFGWALLDMS